MWGKGSCSKDANEKLNARKSVGIKARLSKYTFVPYLKFVFYKTYFTLWEEECLEIAGLFKNFFWGLSGKYFSICTNVQSFKPVRILPGNYSKLDKL